ncbi:MAG: linked oxidase protein [Gemmatimonadetes bacterium]|jgi:glycolate oxidase FAD binding subunit|nr:linked oxidase protein [Gemmatimonadota bacterium]
MARVAGRASTPERVTTTAARELSARVAEARRHGTPLRIVGAGHWLDAGRPCTAAHILDLAALTGIVEYEPGDLTLTARAATSLAEIARVTRAEGQWLPLDPSGSPDGTLGATVATASAGPLATAYGTPRDQVLGCEIVDGRGEILRAGGRVVKNVAGFDLTRLMIGAWGTLGVLTEITIRLRARPEADETVAIALRDASRVEAALQWLRASEYRPLAAELISARLAGTLGIPVAEQAMLLRFGGNGRYVRAAVGAAAALGETMALPSGIWSGLALAEPERCAVVRLSTMPSKVGQLWSGATAITERAGAVAHATPQRGIVRCILPLRDGGIEEIGRLRGIIQALPSATRIEERLPAPLWPAAAHSAVSDGLAAGVRRVFDPERLLNPGILDDTA